MNGKLFENRTRVLANAERNCELDFVRILANNSGTATGMPDCIRYVNQPKPFSRHYAALSCLACLCFTAPFATKAKAATATNTPQAAPAANWAVELASGVTFANVRDPHIPGYTLVPVDLALSRRLDGPILENFAGGLFRGTPEALIKGNYIAVAHGIESRIAGGDLGARYNFEQPGRNWAPYAEADVGLAWADAHPVIIDGAQHGLGQDFNFTFSLAAGIRFDLNTRTYMRLGAVFSHYSNGGLSEPAHSNRAIDAAGPMLAFGLRF
jgi:opacity protein-like surface antigen